MSRVAPSVEVPSTRRDSRYERMLKEAHSTFETGNWIGGHMLEFAFHVQQGRCCEWSSLYSLLWAEVERLVLPLSGIGRDDAAWDECFCLREEAFV